MWRRDAANLPSSGETCCNQPPLSGRATVGIPCLKGELWIQVWAIMSLGTYPFILPGETGARLGLVLGVTASEPSAVERGMATSGRKICFWPFISSRSRGSKTPNSSGFQSLPTNIESNIGSTDEENLLAGLPWNLRNLLRGWNLRNQWKPHQ